MDGKIETTLFYNSGRPTESTTLEYIITKSFVLLNKFTVCAVGR